LELIDMHLSLGLAATALLALRMLLTPLLLYNMGWSFKGFRQLVQGRAYPTSLYQTVVFMFSGAVLGYNGLTFGGRLVSDWSEPWSLGFQCMIAVASVSALIGRRIAVTIDFERFYWLFTSDNLEVAVRAAELNMADPEYTQEMLNVAETTVAVRLAKRAINGTAD
tara:strand:- start:75867 stop:76364 length:498 start_codon:yes stop_codon:yes gene_type:complete